MRPLHISVRSTLDWQDPAVVEARLLPQFRPKFDAWNATFNMPYHAFRHRLRQIAQVSHDLVEGATCSAVDKVPSGHIIVPVDDDDWFAPDLANHLQQEYDPGARGYLWTREVIEAPSRTRSSLRRIARLLGRRQEKFICKSNNYAIVNEPDLAHLALNHVRASQYFDAHPSDIRRISATLAIQNRTLASQTTLAWGRPSIRRDELVILLHRYRGLYSSWQVHAELSWAKPYVDMMAELMQDIDTK